MACEIILKVRREIRIEFKGVMRRKRLCGARIKFD